MTTALKASAGQIIAGQSLDNPPSSIVLAAVGTDLGVNQAVEFGVGPGVHAIEVVMVNAAGTNPVFTLGIDAFNSGDNTWENLVTSASITAAATVVLQVNPFSAPISNSSAQRIVRRRMRIVLTYTSGTVTGSIQVHAA